VLLPSLALFIGTMPMAVWMAQYSRVMACVWGLPALCAGVIAARSKGRLLHITDEGGAAVETRGVFGTRREVLQSSWQVLVCPFESILYRLSLPCRGWCAVVTEGGVSFPLAMHKNVESLEESLATMPPVIAKRVKPMNVVLVTDY
jgi:hypothetical protein